jgi:N-acyl-phosphatidylethanolamine-hydrolysing phospholipase D
MGLKSEDLLAKSKNFTVMDWCSKYEYEVKGRKYEIHFLPSCHWSGRGVFDHFKRLWGSFLLITPEKKKIYYPGDTGYCKELFQEINQRYGDIDCCLLPIGAYEPREFLCFQHINPEEAVFIHYHLKSRQSLGVHWGTFQLACEGFLQPREDLEKVLKREEIYKENNGNFCCVEPGQSLILGIDVTTPFFDVS